MAGITTQGAGARSGSQAAELYNQQLQQTGQTIADILAQGDALKGDLQGRINGGSQGYYTGGSSGYYVDNSPQVNAQYNTIRDDVGNVFGQAQGQILGQAPQIQADTSSKVNAIAALLASQNGAAQQATSQQLSDQQLAAQRMGIDAAPQTARANALAGALANYRNTGAGLQKNYFGAIGQTALGRNQAQADAFKYTNSQQQEKIEAARQAALAKASYWVPGSKGRYVSTYGSAAKKADKSQISAITKEQKAISSAQKKDAAQRAKDPSIRQSAIQANRRLT